MEVQALSPLLPSPPISGAGDLALRTNLFFSAAAKSRPLTHTLKLLPLLPTHDAVTWNTAISACIRHRHPSAALRLFLRMLLSPSSPPPDPITLRAALRACSLSSARHRRLLPQLHAYILKHLPSLSSSDQSILSTCLLNSYFKFESHETAHEVFDRMPQRDVVALASVISGYTQCQLYEEALRVFSDAMECDEVEMNEHVYSCALSASANLPSLAVGRQIHARVVKSTVDSGVFVGTGLVNMYAKSGDIGSARKAFLEIEEPNVVSWNALLGGKLDGEEGLRMFDQMMVSGARPDKDTFASVLRGCKEAVGICAVKQMHGLILKMVEGGLDVFVGGALFELYLDRGFFVEAHRIFGEIEEKDDVALNLAIQGFLRNGRGAEAIRLFIEVLMMGKEVSDVTMKSLLIWAGGLEQGKQVHALVTKFGYCNGGGSSTSIPGSLVIMYAKQGCLDDAICLFERIHLPDLVLWTSLISEVAQTGENQQALHLYIRMMSEGLTGPPNHYTFSTLLSSCANLVALEEGKQIHAQIFKSDPKVRYDAFVASASVYMYARCGCLEEAKQLFNEMPIRDMASWNAMINCLAQQGFPEEAIQTFRKLLDQRDLEPNHITYLGVLSAYSQCGMVEEGCRVFKSIKEPIIDHYASLIDLLLRAGRLKEAIDITKEMPFEANEHIWSSLLKASIIHRNVELRGYSVKQLLHLDPKYTRIYLTLSNMYAAAGSLEDAKRTRKVMNSRKERKKTWGLV